ncbi:MAG: peptidase M3, partial [Dysgonamonadaceae bacterium]
MSKLFIQLIFMSILIHTSAAGQVNPFYTTYDTPHGTPPFDKIKTEHYMPAFEKGMEEHQKEINSIVENEAAPTFQNTIEAMEYAGDLLDKVSNVFFNLLSSESDDEMMKISQELSPKLSEHSNNIGLNEKLFQKIKTVYENRLTSGLTPEQIRLTEKVYQGFERNGANLSDKEKESYRKLSMELSKRTLEFGQNNLKETNKYSMLLTDESDLAGLPESVLDAASAKAKSKGKEGWMFDLSAPSYIGFMKYSANRPL